MIFVTGASGNVGKEIVQHLLRRQASFRVGVRSAETGVTPAGVNTVRFDFLDAGTYRSAVEGCDAVFLLRPPAISNTRKTLNVFLDVARQCGVSQVVFISVAGAGNNPIVPHHAVEQHLRAGPAGWTILRPGFFSQNVGGAYRDDIRWDDRIYLPAGSARVAFVDTRDIAEVAVNALMAPAAHLGKTYTLSGPEAISFQEIASMLTEELGRHIRYQPASIAAYFLHLLRRRMPVMQILVESILHLSLRFGQTQAVDKSLSNLLGHPPGSMRDYIREHRSLWLRLQPTNLSQLSTPAFPELQNANKGDL